MYFTQSFQAGLLHSNKNYKKSECIIGISTKRYVAISTERNSSVIEKLIQKKIKLKKKVSKNFHLTKENVSTNLRFPVCQGSIAKNEISFPPRFELPPKFGQIACLLQRFFARRAFHRVNDGNRGVI